jgi:hypothetical protein
MSCPARKRDHVVSPVANSASRTPKLPLNLGSFLALFLGNFHAGLNKLGFVLQFLLFCGPSNPFATHRALPRIELRRSFGQFLVSDLLSGSPRLNRTRPGIEFL